MAASPNDGHCTVEVPIDSNHDHQSPATVSTAVNGHDSGSHCDPNCEATGVPLSDSAVVGEKRKRENEEETVPPVDPFRNTSLCSYFRRTGGSCRHGEGCKYAHGEEELRPRPDGSWDPTSEREKKNASVGENDDGDDDNKDQDEDDGCSDVMFEKCVKNLPRRWKNSDLIKFLDNNGIPYKTAKKVKHQNLGFLKFESKEQMSRAMKELEGKSTGAKTVEVAEVREKKFPPPSDASKDNPELDGSKEKNARDVVTPLAHLPYDDQLELKRTTLVQILKRLTRNARKACPAGVSLPDWILKSRDIAGLPCKFEGIVASPIVFGYRNKCEFTIGNSLQGKPTVGFTLGNFREGMTAVGEPIDCPNVSIVARKYASTFQEFLQHSALPVWDRHKNAGFWRQFTVREGRKPGATSDAENVDAIAEVMLIIQVSSINYETDVIAREFEELAEAFSTGAVLCSPPLPLTALIVQEHQGISNVAPADAPLHSLLVPKIADAPPVEETNNTEDPRIHDYISNLRFSISPTAFFQVNTLAAEKLYSLAGDWAGLDADTLLFDVCCGTGTIGLTLAHRVGMVVGVEMNASAVSDAHRNAEINGIKNCRFVCSKAEDVMGSLLKDYITTATETAEGDGSEVVTSTKEVEGDDIITNDKMMQDPNLEKENDQSHNSATVEQEMKEARQDSCSGQQQFKNVVAIVDPPRGGLHPTVLKALRTHPSLRKLVYISCNPESLVANAIELCSQCPESEEKGKKDNRGWRHMSNSGIARRRLKSMPKSEPFQPVKALAVDLFPHTPHCEVLMLLER